MTELLTKLEETTPKPSDAVIYEPGDAGLEALSVAKEFSENAYGGMPVQVGYCNGNNTKLNCLEYHRGSEINVPADDMVLLLALLQCVKDGSVSSDGFRVIVVLPKDTNTKKPEITIKNGEDKLLWARNKWLIAHPDSSEAKQGAFVGLTGKNINIQGISKNSDK